jgi:oligoendopeptidase F
LDEYYALEAKSAGVTDYQAFLSGYGLEMEAVFAEMVKVRQQIADYAGYESYGQFAYEFHYQRDYTTQQTQNYVQTIARELSPLYMQLADNSWDALYTTASQEDTYAYLENFVQAVGGIAEDALKLMEKAELYHITPGENKYGASFETFLFNYYEPFLFMNPSGYARDKLTLVHEFGHFCNDYAVSGTMAGIDVAEVFSQGLEYLSLCYTEEGKALQKGKMADSLSIFVEQSMYAAFELAVYELEEVTVDNIRNTFTQTCKEFGLGAYSVDSRSYVTVPHFFIAPMYVISYVVSNDVALQIYQEEQKTPGAGVKLWEDGLFTMQIGLLGFVEEMKLTSPFEENRIAQIRDTFAEILK